jgi:hypothetical protein
MASDQIWFFLWENMKPSTSLPSFKQGHLTLAEVKKNGMTLETCLQMATVDSNADEHTFWIHSNSMKAAVQLLSDKSIEVTWNLYCQADDVVTIHIRTTSDPSPNTSKASSYNNSLAERRKVSGQRRKVSEIFIRTPLDHGTSGLDAATLEPIRDLDEDDKVTIDIKDGKRETFSKAYLLGKNRFQLTLHR